ncbi:hypothetical protein GCM10008090_01950 [Arenicella chitinivorans]|uniref:Uncharacterized protein n=1 Tax=Arenicella chitinivorans TaxID=1329800 RepID=A0A918VGK9_9GAMM|nr:hypothetical protein GCM10008090_01950 [Arenicella chitinivorans]
MSTKTVVQSCFGVDWVTARYWNTTFGSGANHVPAEIQRNDEQSCYATIDLYRNL